MYPNHAKRRYQGVPYTYLYTLIISFGILGIARSNAQYRTLDLPTPKPASLMGMGHTVTMTHNNPTTLVPNHILAHRSHGNEQVKAHEAYVRAQAQAEAMKEQALQEWEFSRKAMVYLNLPSHQGVAGTEHYRNAYTQLLAIDRDSFYIKEATHIVENAHYEGSKDYDQFNATIQRTGDFLREKMEELGLSQNSNLDMNYMLFRFFGDTLEITSKGLTHIPFSYDFDDYWGKKDWGKMLVHKLLETGKGQCNSLPKLYLILAEELGATAHLARSPNHSYIKFPDDMGRWHNVELTNHMLTSDAFILNSGYVKSQAIQNKIFMHPMDDKQLLSQHFDQLALGYIRKYGYDGFVEEVLDTALEIDPHNITAQLAKANLETLKLKHATERLNITKENFGDIRKYPPLVKLYNKVVSRYDTIDNLGYTEMPQEVYEKWLATVDNKEAQQLNKSFNIQPINTKKD